jgi:glycosyltransferase involved in cell wall biosynthesis
MSRVENVSSSKQVLKVLVLDEYFPYPPNSGKPIRTWNLIRRLCERHKITLLCYGEASSIPASVLQTPNLKVVFVPPLPTLSGMGLYLRLLANGLSIYPYSVDKHYTARFRKALETLLKENAFDLVQVEWTPYARYSSVVGNLKVVIATHNVESQILSRRMDTSTSLFERVFFLIQAKKMKWFERSAVRQAAGVTAVSEGDARQLEAWRCDHVSVVDNGVDLEFYHGNEGSKNPESRNSEILFFASLDWQPNLDGLKFFLAEIFPKILIARPDVILTVAGRNPPASLKGELASIQNVSFLGEVSDARVTVGAADVIVVPLRIGGGSRLKILEAMAMSKAVIATSIGAEGLEVEGQKHLLIADEPQKFADAVVSLLGSPSKRIELGRSARALVENRYSWDRCALNLEEVWYRTQAPQEEQRAVARASVSR